jgi:hypothetical protein
MTAGRNIVGASHAYPFGSGSPAGCSKKKIKKIKANYYLFKSQNFKK